MVVTLPDEDIPKYADDSDDHYFEEPEIFHSPGMYHSARIAAPIPQRPVSVQRGYSWNRSPNIAAIQPPPAIDMSYALLGSPSSALYDQ